MLALNPVVAYIVFAAALFTIKEYFWRVNAVDGREDRAGSKFPGFRDRSGLRVGVSW